MTEDPPRLVDDPSAAASLREDLRSAIEHPPQIPLPAELPAPSSAAPFPLGLVAVGVLAVAVLALLLWPAADDPGGASTPAAPAPTEAVAPEAVAPEAVAPEPLDADRPAAAPDAGALVAEASDPTPPEPPVVVERADRSQRAEPPPTVADEVAHMAELRRIARAEPARALAMAREGERRFRGGLFSEERQAIVVLSLDRLGRARAARRHAERFLRRYPNSTLAGVIRPIAGAER